MQNNFRKFEVEFETDILPSHINIKSMAWTSSEMGDLGQFFKVTEPNFRFLSIVSFWCVQCNYEMIAPIAVMFTRIMRHINVCDLHLHFKVK